MASRAAMLLDPKGFKKQMKKNGTASTSPSPTRNCMKEPSNLRDLGEGSLKNTPEELSSTSLSSSPNHPTMDLTEATYLHSLGVADLGSNSDSQPSENLIAPPGTAPAVEFSAKISRKSSPHNTPNTSTTDMDPPAKVEDEVAVQFTNAQDDNDDHAFKRKHYETTEEEPVTRPSNFLEDLYDVENRKHPPTKKMKSQEASNPGTPSQPVDISGSSELGQFMKDNQNDLGAKTAAQAVVDLTATPPKENSEDDELQVVGSNDLSKQRVCFGKVEATINATMVPKPSDTSRSIFPDQWPTVKLELRRHHDRHDRRIFAEDPHGANFGLVDPKTANALCPLLDSPHISLDIAARLDMRPITVNEVPWTPTSAGYKASLTLYGERQRAEIIGKHLSQCNVWLGHPPIVEKGTPTFNPHEQMRRAAAASQAANSNGRDRLGPRYEVKTMEEVTDSVTKMLNQLQSADIPTMEPPDTILTEMLEHQKQALWFMTEKEKPRKFGRKDADNNSLWRRQRAANGDTEYREIISQVVLPDEPPQVLGGLLADVMGLGKTLSILSLVLSSLDDARQWVNTPPGKSLSRTIPGIRNTRTTLLVAPLSAVKNWETQINEHLKPHALKSYIFHGPNRELNPKILGCYDLIITTYSTVLSEIRDRSGRGMSPLARMNMFRIVLDEAHTIREQNAQQTKAILSLNAQRRWSVTGTPIQNRLEDLLSVTRFLRLYPYNDRAHFNQFIISRFKTGDTSVLASLRVFIDSFTLRRVKNTIKLTAREDKIIMLDFNKKEKDLHDFFRNESNVMMRVLTSDNRSNIGGRMYHHVLKAMMILRQVSAHGKELLNVDDRERVKGLSLNDAIDLEENEQSDSGAATEKKAYGMLALMRESSADQCAVCRTNIEDPSSTSDTNSEEVDYDAPIAYFLPCFDVLCPKCFAEWKLTWDDTPDTDIMCKACDGWIPKSSTELTPGGADNYAAQQEQDRYLRRHGKVMGEYEGPHTKTLALIAHLQTTLMESNALMEKLQADGEPSESPIKSVVFSQWTSHLDLIEIALKNNGLDTFTRLDGTMTLAARGKALQDFATNDNITILLATIGAGGVGLNLTSASRVYIMEPHYNPAAVAQAVDRVHRLGQKRDVQTIQFVMKESIEEKIQELAKKKQRLADMSMNKSKLDKKEIQEQRMAEYRELFR